MSSLDPKVDVVFKLLLTREPALLRDMLQGILARPIPDLTLLNPGIPGELASDKQIVLDIRAALDDGSHVDLEMQLRNLPALASRLLFYAARDYAGRLNRGEKYHLLTPTTGIVWLLKPLFPTLDRLHAIFELRERHTALRFSDQLAIHVLQLSHLSRSNATGYTATVERWARFLVASGEEERERLALEDPIMRIAKQTLDRLSEDPATRRLAREREDSIKLYEMHLAASRAEGEAQGRAQILLEQLGLRFGPLDAATRARVREAEPAQVSVWAQRILTATSLDEVLAP